ncbi:hypothetical protein CN105_34620, partial [Sinorhizobium meliloti]
MAPVYTSDPALPRCPQDSVPACPLWLWPDGTCTHKQLSAWHDVLPGSGVGGGWVAAFSGMGRDDQRATAGRLMSGS